MDYEKAGIPTVSDLSDIGQSGYYKFNESIVTQELLPNEIYDPPLNVHDLEGNRVGQIFKSGDGQIWCRKAKPSSAAAFPEWNEWICWIGQYGYPEGVNGAHEYIMDGKEIGGYMNDKVIRRVTINGVEVGDIALSPDLDGDLISADGAVPIELRPRTPEEEAVNRAVQASYKNEK